jgi:hypothetical protein
MMFFGAAASAAAIAMLNELIGRVLKEVLEPATSLVGSPLDAIWRGDDADLFKRKVLQGLVSILTSVAGYGNATVDGLNRAMELINNADRQGASAVGELNNLFSNIL